LAAESRAAGARLGHPASSAPWAVVVLADDLIWSTRLVAQVRAAGHAGSAVRTAADFAAALATADAAIVDLTSLAYDGLAAIAAARDAGRPVLAVGQHDDHVLRRDALAVGADRVLAYRKLFEDGPATIGRWLTMAARPGQPDPTAPPEEAPTR
jgi:DNA-binding NarL/FixJ family response regulator